MQKRSRCLFSLISFQWRSWRKNPWIQRRKKFRNVNLRALKVAGRTLFCVFLKDVQSFQANEEVCYFTLDIFESHFLILYFDGEPGTMKVHGALTRLTWWFDEAGNPWPPYYQNYLIDLRFIWSEYIVLLYCRNHQRNHFGSLSPKHLLSQRGTRVLLRKHELSQIPLPIPNVLAVILQEALPLPINVW